MIFQFFYFTFCLIIKICLLIDIKIIPFQILRANSFQEYSINIALDTYKHTHIYIAPWTFNLTSVIIT